MLVADKRTAAGPLCSPHVTVMAFQRTHRPLSPSDFDVSMHRGHASVSSVEIRTSRAQNIDYAVEDGAAVATFLGLTVTAVVVLPVFPPNENDGGAAPISATSSCAPSSSAVKSFRSSSSVKLQLVSRRNPLLPRSCRVARTYAGTSVPALGESAMASSCARGGEGNNQMEGPKRDISQATFLDPSVSDLTLTVPLSSTTSHVPSSCTAF